MGAVTGEMKNKLVERLKEEAKYVTIASQTTVTPENSAAGTSIKKTSHGLLTGDIIVFTALNGGSGLVVGRPYWAIKVDANNFAVGFTKAQAESETKISFTTEIKETTTTVAKIAEHTGAKTTRKATNFGAVATGKCEDTEAHEIEATTSVTVQWLMLWTASSSGTLIGLHEVTSRSLVSEDIYKVTSGTLEDLISA